MNKRQVRNLMDNFGYELDDEGQVVIYTNWYLTDTGQLTDDLDGEDN